MAACLFDLVLCPSKRPMMSQREGMRPEFTVRMARGWIVKRRVPIMSSPFWVLPKIHRSMY